jgi:GTP diphosphokinase / guanosine-3',5'-bis(diphosphate) 3'-diphosphatase
MNTLNKLLEAASFAAKRHSDNKRKGSAGEPYINHPLEVANLLASVGKVEDYDVLIAAMLHDTVEDTGTTVTEIRERFGERVASIVAEVTDDKTLPKAKRKELQVEHAPHLSREAKIVKLGDKISNIRDIIDNPPEGWDLDRRRGYIDWGEDVVNGMRGTNSDLEALFDEIVGNARETLG